MSAPRSFRFPVLGVAHPLVGMRMMDFDGFATAHDGLITLEASGLSKPAWHRAVRSGRFDQIHPYVARLPGTSRSQEQRIAAAVLAAGPGAMASHRSAARLCGIPRPADDPVDLIVTDRGRSPELAGVVVHRPTDRRRLIPSRREGIRCTNPLRTLVDLGAVDPHGVSDAVGRLLRDRIVPLGALDVALAEHSEHGRSGVGPLRRAVADWTLDMKPADSVLEPAMHRLARRYDLPTLEFHPAIERWEVDFRVGRTALLLECDGWTSHGLDREQFERDRLKDDDLRAAGWIVIRFTYRSVVLRPSDTARRIRRSVERWATIPVPDE